MILLKHRDELSQNKVIKHIYLSINMYTLLYGGVVACKKNPGMKSRICILYKNVFLSVFWLWQKNLQLITGLIFLIDL